MEKIIVNLKTVADFFRVSRQTVGKWNIQPVKTSVNEKLYDLQAVYDYVREAAQKKAGGLTEQRTRYVKLQADRAELEVELYKNELHDARVVKSIWTDQILRFRSRLLSVPTKLSLSLAALSEPSKVEKALHKEVLDVLEELQEYKASDYKALVSWEDSESESNDIPDDDQPKKKTKVSLKRLKKKK